jgi:hypothetical protein
VRKELNDCGRRQRRYSFAIYNVPSGKSISYLCSESDDTVAKLQELLGNLRYEIQKGDEFIANEKKISHLENEITRLQNLTITMTDEDGRRKSIGSRTVKFKSEIDRLRERNSEIKVDAETVQLEVPNFDGNSDGREFVFWLTGALEKRKNSPNIAAIFSLIGLDTSQIDDFGCYVRTMAKSKSNKPDADKYHLIVG